MNQASLDEDLKFWVLCTISEAFEVNSSVAKAKKTSSKWRLLQRAQLFFKPFASLAKSTSQVTGFRNVFISIKNSVTVRN